MGRLEVKMRGKFPINFIFKKEPTKFTLYETIQYKNCNMANSSSAQQFFKFCYAVFQPSKKCIYSNEVCIKMHRLMKITLAKTAWENV